MSTTSQYLAGLAVLAAAGSAAAEPTSGVDSVLFRSSYDAGGIFSLEGARLAPRGDLSFKMLGSFERTPLKIAVPGIGAAMGDLEKDRVLDYVAVLDLAVALSLTDRVTFGLDVAAFRPKCHFLHYWQTTVCSGPDHKSLAFPRYLSSMDRGVCPNSSRNFLEGVFLRLRTSLRSITTSCSYLLPSTRRVPKENLSKCIHPPRSAAFTRSSWR